MCIYPQPFDTLATHQIGDNFDICELEFRNLTACGRSSYIAIKEPQAVTEVITQAPEAEFSQCKRALPSQDCWQTNGNPELNLAENDFLELMATLNADNVPQFLRWSQALVLPDVDLHPHLVFAPPPPAGPATSPSCPASDAAPPPPPQSPQSPKPPQPPPYEPPPYDPNNPLYTANRKA